MAEIYKRKNSKYWWARIKLPTGGRILESTGTEDQSSAQHFADRRQHLLWAENKLGQKSDHTWKEAVLKWCKEKRHKKTLNGDIAKFRWFDQHFGDKKLSEINRDAVMKVGAIKAAEASEATANRHLALIRALLLRAAHTWEWTEKAPKIDLFPELKRRVRWLRKEEVERLLDALPEHQADLMKFALATGLRQRNILDLSWEQIDIGMRCAWIHSDQAKAGEAIGIPLNRLAMSVLEKQIGKHPDRVFTYRGKPIKSVNTKSWRNALQRVGIVNFRWHDLRHTWASWLIQAGVSLVELQELGGWETESMVRRYAHLSSSHLAKAAAKLDEQQEGTEDLCRASRIIDS